MRVRHRARTGAVLRCPLLGAGRTRRQLPLVVEQMLEEVVAPLGRRRRPGDFETAGNGMGAFARLVATPPAKALLFEVAPLRFGADMLVRRRRTMRLAERMSAWR